MYGHILIPTDGSEVSQSGVDHGLSLAKALSAKVTVIAVTERLPIHAGGVGLDVGMSDSTVAEYRAAQETSAHAALAAAERSANGHGISIETLHVPDAQPANAIIQAAASRDCSLIAMASHGRRGLSRLFLGSTTAEVLAHSSIPVLVVR